MAERNPSKNPIENIWNYFLVLKILIYASFFNKYRSEIVGWLVN